MIGVLWSLVMAALFGFSQLAARKGLTGIAVDQGTFIMIIVSTGLMAIPFFWLGGPALIQQTELIGLAYFLMAGLIHFVGGFTLLNTSISRVGAARTGSLVATTPLFATFLAALTLKELVNAPLIIGVVVVIVGVRLIASTRSVKTELKSQTMPPTQETGANNQSSVPDVARLGIVASTSSGIFSLTGDSIFGLLAALSWGFTPVLIKKGLESLPSPLVGLTLAMASAGVVHTVILAIRGRLRPVLSSLGQPAALWQAGAGALVGLGTWCRWIALSFTTAAMVTTLSRASLLITVGLSGRLLGRELEPVTDRVRWGALLIVIGSIVVVLFGRP
jgi:drug/metabolite transporter (DMT)-like permease